MERNRYLKLIIALELMFIITIGIISIRYFRVFSQIDESPHLANIAILSQEHHLPVLGVDPNPFDYFEPIANTSKPGDGALARYAYEAFQPPLYYLMMSPFYNLVVDIGAKVIVFRSLNFVLYLASVWLFWRLNKLIFKDYLAPIAMGLSVFMLPGMIIRAITINNSVLEIPLVLISFILLIKLWREPKLKYLALSAIFLSLCILAKLTLAYLIPVVAVILAVMTWTKKLKPSQLIVFILMVIAILLPWFIFNYQHYHALTANTLAKDMAFYTTNPTNQKFAAADFPGLTHKSLISLILPEEWLTLGATTLFKTYLGVFSIILIVLPIILWLNQRRIKDLVLAVPFFLNLSQQNLITILQDYPVSIGRYLYSSLVVWAIFASRTLMLNLSKRALDTLIILAASSALGLWIFIYFKIW